jgi:hypothetical protein
MYVSFSEHDMKKELQNEIIQFINYRHFVNHYDTWDTLLIIQVNHIIWAT